MIEEKGLDPAVADKIGEYVQLKGWSNAHKIKIRIFSHIYLTGGAELMDKLRQDSAILANANAKQGLEEMTILVSLLQAYKIIDKVHFKKIVSA